MGELPKSEESRQISHLGLEEIVHATNKIGMQYCEAKKKFDRLDLLKASHRAQAMEKYDDGIRSETKIKRMAEIDPSYMKYLEDLSEAKAVSEKLRLRYESYKNLFEAKRSVLSFQKAEMRLY